MPKSPKYTWKLNNMDVEVSSLFEKELEQATATYNEGKKRLENLAKFHLANLLGVLKALGDDSMLEGTPLVRRLPAKGVSTSSSASILVRQQTKVGSSLGKDLSCSPIPCTLESARGVSAEVTPHRPPVLGPSASTPRKRVAATKVTPNWRADDAGRCDQVCASRRVPRAPVPGPSDICVSALYRVVRRAADSVLRHQGSVSSLVSSLGLLSSRSASLLSRIGSSVTLETVGTSVDVSQLSKSCALIDFKSPFGRKKRSRNKSKLSVSFPATPARTTSSPGTPVAAL